MSEYPITRYIGMGEFENQNRPHHLEPWQHNFEWSYWKEIKFND